MKRRQITPKLTVISDPRLGVTPLEILLVLAILGLLATLLFPLVMRWRETSRLNTCRDRLKNLTLALHQYEDVHGVLPPAAIWDVNATHSLALHDSKQIDVITRENWGICLLPFLDQTLLYKQFDPQRSIGSDTNSEVRTTSLSAMNCPSDGFNSARNAHDFFPPDGAEIPISFARGNFAINGGTHNLQSLAPSTQAAGGDLLHIQLQESPRQFQMWGNGIAGINKCFSSEDFRNGKSTLVALEEVRAGIHPLDPRGVWALGQIGGSITWGHGVNGDDYGPNNQWERSDDILGGGVLHEILGPEKLAEERMPCVSYVDINAQAGARSLHPGGAQVAFCDGSVRFISDKVDPGLWHVMHSRETPSDVLATHFDADLEVENFPEEIPLPRNLSNMAQPPGDRLRNSLGMEFVLVPAGEFQMGVPDLGNQSNPPPECPEHTVRISCPFLVGVHEVTNEQFLKIVPGAMTPQVGDSAPEWRRFPVTNITWNSAAEFCALLSQRPEEQQAGRSYRLPTEAEWEYVCRAGTSQPYHWKLHRDPTDISGETAGSSPILPLQPVGSFPPNPLGVHDIRGNAWEWTADWFDRDYYLRSSVVDPQGPKRGFLKVVRGGDWRFVGEVCRIDYPMLPPWKGNPFVGFRVICDFRANEDGFERQ